MKPFRLLLIILVIVFLLSGLPIAHHYHSFGYTPMYGGGFLLVIVIILLLTGI